MVLTATNLARRSALGCFTAVLIAAAALAGCANIPTGGGQTSPLPSPVVRVSTQPSAQPTLQPLPQPPGQPSAQPKVQPSVQPSAQPTVPTLPQPTDGPWVPGQLTEPGLDLHAGPVSVPLELRIPTLNVSAPVMGVGITSLNVMDAPKGSIGDPVWQAAFWYRGSGIPGDVGTATFAGHVNDPLARPGPFARLKDLRAGDLVIIHDTRNGRDIKFTITRTVTYSVEQTSDPVVLAQIYGAGPVSGRGPQPAPDGLSHLTLITCTGYIVGGTFDHHVVVFATRTE
jgi:sortase (surface protein transpeptidase)